MSPDPRRRPDDPSNPYAPPESELAPWGTYVPKRPGFDRFDGARVIERAWEVYKDRFGLVVGVILCGMMLNLMYYLAGEAMAENVDQESTMGMVADVVFRIAAFVLQTWLTGGQTLALVKAARGEDADLGDLFRGGAYVLPIVLATLASLAALLAVVAVAVGLPLVLLAGLQGPQALGGAFLAWLLWSLFVVMTLWVLYFARFYQYIYLIVDQGCGPIESLRLSWRITRGHGLEVLGLLLVSLVISLSGLFALCFGVLFTYPLGVLLMAVTYVALNGESDQAVLRRPGEGDPV